MRGPALAACGYQAISAVALGPEPRLKHPPRLRFGSLQSPAGWVVHVIARRRARGRRFRRLADHVERLAATAPDIGAGDLGVKVVAAGVAVVVGHSQFKADSNWPIR